MSFAAPLWLAVAAMLLAAFVLWLRRKESDDWHRVMALDVLRFLRPAANFGRHRQPALLAAAICAAALASPITRLDGQDAYRHREAFIFLIDLSRSMALDDVAPSRFAAARDAALELSHSIGAASGATVVFAGDAYLAAPPSFDLAHMRAIIRDLEPGLVPVAGSDVARALTLTAATIEKNGLHKARLLLMSDAGPVQPAAYEMAERLASGGHRLDVLSFAPAESEAGPPIDRAAAERLAQAGGGRFFELGADGAADLAGLLDGSRGGFSAAADLVTGIDVTGSRNNSHWILLLALPVLMVLFHRAAAR